MIEYLRKNAAVAEWQTRRTQNPLRATSCGFDSHQRHQTEQIRTSNGEDFFCLVFFTFNFSFFTFRYFVFVLKLKTKSEKLKVY